MNDKLLTVSLRLRTKVIHWFEHEDVDRSPLVECDHRDLVELSDRGQQAFDKVMLDNQLV